MLDDATLLGGITVSDGLTVTGPTSDKLLISGTIAPGTTVTVTYQVTVNQDNGQGDRHLRNFVTASGEEPPNECVSDNPLCTQNPTAPPNGDSLPNTGSEVPMGILAAGLLLLGGGGVLMALARRRRERSQAAA